MEITPSVAREIVTGDSDLYNIIDDGEWISDGKYENKKVIFKDRITGRTYALYVNRSGSPFTEWYYSWEYEDMFACPEVEEVEVVIKEWHEKKIQENL